MGYKPRLRAMTSFWIYLAREMNALEPGTQIGIHTHEKSRSTWPPPGTGCLPCITSSDEVSAAVDLPPAVQPSRAGALSIHL